MTTNTNTLYPETCRRMTMTAAKHGQNYTVCDIHIYPDGWTATLDTEVEALRIAVAFQGLERRTSVAPANDGRWLTRLVFSKDSPALKGHQFAVVSGIFR